MNRITWTYTLLAYFITWSITLTSYFLYRCNSLTFNQLNLIYNFGALGPFIASIVSAWLYYGKEGLKKLFSTFSFKTASKKSLLLSCAPFILFFISLLLYPLFTGHWFSFADTQRQFNLTTQITYINWILPFITYSIFEEFGWRGFLLPHLQDRYSALNATLILTMIWACWHLPFFLWRFTFSPLAIVGFFFLIFIGATIISSVYNLGRGSIAPVILFHFANNVTSALDKEYIVSIVSTGFVFLAIYSLRKYGSENLSDKKRIQNFYKE